MLEIFIENSEISLKRINTEDETWPYYYDPRTKRMSMELNFPGQARPTVVRRERSVKKSLLVVFFDYKGIYCRATFLPASRRKAMNSSILDHRMFDEAGKKDQENAFQDWISRAVFAARKRLLSYLCTNNEIPKKEETCHFPSPAL
ncbi:hypothetical protein BV898_06127 [Hypsibius exemplaris]|uniref:Uncharacterized protein n=1 Tax=Hypsibius exemplaris TaxID=2072580 RepID=A0A1W0WXD7_HYPEX|nr:hypothetical protein BV898_06127 [Hypsibius exemplaris]